MHGHMYLNFENYLFGKMSMDDMTFIEMVGKVKAAFIIRPDATHVYQSGRNNFILTIFQGDFFLPSFTNKILTELKKTKHKN